MAVKLDAGDVGRTDALLISPENIKLGINGRWQPHSDSAIHERCLSFEEHGQIQEITVRKLPDKTVELVYGYLRHAAALLYNQRHHDNPMKLRCRIVDCNQEESFIKNVVENHERQETSPMDDAFAQRRLREEYGWTNVKIAELYHVTQPYISKLAKLLTLSTKIQKQVHARKLSVTAAIELTNLPEAEHDAILATQEPLPGTGEKNEAREPPEPFKAQESHPERNGTPVATATEKITARVREKAVEAGGKKGRTLSEVKKFFLGLIASEENPSLEPIAKLMTRFIEGAIVDKTMVKKLGELFPATQETK